ncbi:hypothetical protein C2G38_2151926 [Gigaspora rosea]|uniref:Uncharacterized protein n=1 Tax=Gigaspora rosea TaxID=44941 RepID=A0A397W7I8_9GLOM|nr:hypothetical protein C2G38_2151926 [Gigaspora rosea]
MDTFTITAVILELSSKETNNALIDSEPYESNEPLENKIRKIYQKLLTSTRSKPRRVQTLFYAYCLSRLIEEELFLPLEHASYTQNITKYYKKVFIRAYQLFKYIIVWNLYTEPVPLI